MTRRLARAALVLLDAAPLMLLPTAFVAYLLLADQVQLARLFY